MPTSTRAEPARPQRQRDQGGQGGPGRLGLRHGIEDVPAQTVVAGQGPEEECTAQAVELCEGHAAGLVRHDRALEEVRRILDPCEGVQRVHDGIVRRIEIGVEVANLVWMPEAERVADFVHHQTHQGEARQPDADAQVFLGLPKKRRVQIHLAAHDDEAIGPPAVREKALLEEDVSGAAKTEHRRWMFRKGEVEGGTREDVDLATEGGAVLRAIRLELDLEAERLVLPGPERLLDREADDLDLVRARGTQILLDVRMHPDLDSIGQADLRPRLRAPTGSPCQDFLQRDVRVVVEQRKGPCLAGKGRQGSEEGGCEEQDSRPRGRAAWQPGSGHSGLSSRAARDTA